MSGYDAHGIGARNADTSQAARPAPHRAVIVRNQVLNLLRLSDGLTCDEISDTLHLSALTVRPRITELRNAAKITDSKIRRRLHSGKTGIVWRAA